MAKKVVAALSPLTFKIAPHLVQDLGLNLYTNLPKVLVEFVANAYDADSKLVDIRMDFTDIEYQRKLVKAVVDRERQQAAGDPAKLAKIVPLARRVLPETTTVTIADKGCGMSREDLDTQFLVTGRRRRDDAATIGDRSPGGRLIMGRKGVGKLAGFGVAHKITITTRKKGEKHATRIVLDYNEIGKHRTTNDVTIPEERLVDGGGIMGSGTVIVLSELLYEPVRAQAETIEHTLADHFWLLNPGEFDIRLNGTSITPSSHTFRFAWPSPELPSNELVAAEIKTEDDESFTFNYRLRFRAESLKGADRGVRVYSHGRLAATPSLLDAPTGMHGFRQTDYLDGVVEADFIDDQQLDYVATDRQSLRWDTPLLAPLKAMLSGEIQNAVKEFQKDRDQKAEAEVEKDSFTQELIEKAKLPKHRANAVYRMAGVLASICKGGTVGSEYRERIEILVDGVAQGDILAELQKLARLDLPNFEDVVNEITELTKQEFGDFGRYIRGRLSGIESLVKIIDDQDFKLGKNEKELHKLLQENPWLIDPTFTQFLTSNQTKETLFGKLADDLKIGTSAPVGSPASSDRPDLVFLLHNEGLSRVVIVELKAPNVKLNMEHLLQLRDYVRDTKTFLQRVGKPEVVIESVLIGCRERSGSTNRDVLRLEDELQKKAATDAERVYDLMELLGQTKKAHEELLTIYAVPR